MRESSHNRDTKYVAFTNAITKDGVPCIVSLYQDSSRSGCSPYYWDISRIAGGHEFSSLTMAMVALGGASFTTFTLQSVDIPAIQIMEIEIETTVKMQVKKIVSAS